MNKGIFDVLAFIVYEDDSGKIHEDQIGPEREQRHVAATATCAQDRFRERNAAAIITAREAHPDGKVKFLVNKFGNC